MGNCVRLRTPSVRFHSCGCSYDLTSVYLHLLSRVPPTPARPLCASTRMATLLKHFGILKTLDLPSFVFCFLNTLQISKKRNEQNPIQRWFWSAGACIVFTMYAHLPLTHAMPHALPPTPPPPPTPTTPPHTPTTTPTPTTTTLCGPSPPLYRGGPTRFNTSPDSYGPP